MTDSHANITVPDSSPGALTGSGGDGPVARERLAALVVSEYRGRVIDRLGVLVEWRGLDWADTASCIGASTVTRAMCGRCPVVAECLASAITSDDPARWRGGLSRADREHLWAGMERIYRDLRDFELMRLSPGILFRRQGNPGAEQLPVNEARS